MVAELILAKVDVAESKLAVLEARSNELLDSVQFDSVSTDVKALQFRILEETFTDGKHNFFADPAVRHGEMRKVLALAEHRCNSPGQLEICSTA